MSFSQNTPAYRTIRDAFFEQLALRGWDLQDWEKDLAAVDVIKSYIPDWSGKDSNAFLANARCVNLTCIIDLPTGKTDGLAYMTLSTDNNGDLRFAGYGRKDEPGKPSRLQKAVAFARELSEVNPSGGSYEIRPVSVFNRVQGEPLKVTA